MVLGFTSKLPDDSIPAEFPADPEKGGDPLQGEREAIFRAARSRYRKRKIKKCSSSFTFLCMAAAVLCGMINYLTAETLNWFWFAGAGCLCTWLIVTVAYRKRRNLLKNEMWQLLLVTAIAVLWDHFHGLAGLVGGLSCFRFGALDGAQCSMAAHRKGPERLEREEYLFYLIQAAMSRLRAASPGLWPSLVKLHISVGRSVAESASWCWQRCLSSGIERYDTGVPEEVADVKKTVPCR